MGLLIASSLGILLIAFGALKLVFGGGGFHVRSNSNPLSAVSKVGGAFDNRDLTFNFREATKGHSNNLYCLGESLGLLTNNWNRDFSCLVLGFY